LEDTGNESGSRYPHRQDRRATAAGGLSSGKRPEAASAVEVRGRDRRHQGKAEEKPRWHGPLSTHSLQNNHQHRDRGRKGRTRVRPEFLKCPGSPHAVSVDKNRASGRGTGPPALHTSFLTRIVLFGRCSKHAPTCRGSAWCQRKLCQGRAGRGSDQCRNW